MNLKNLAVAVLSILTLASATSELRAEVKLHPIFTDNMVLQRDQPIVVWGTAAPGEKVRVILARITASARPDREQTTIADADGNWHVELKPIAASLSLLGTMTSPSLLGMMVSGENSISLKNIVMGDVYICSGQSNMEWPVNASNNAQAEIAAANFPNIRLLTVPKKIAGTPQKEFAGATSWQVCSPETVPGFSAVGYFFGREVHQKTGIPIGLINASWGGTIAQAWMSRSTLLKRDDLREGTLQTEKNFSDAGASAEERMDAFWTANDAGTREGWSTPAFDDTAWKTMNLPGAWETKGLPDFDGVIWFRRTIEIPANLAGQDLTLYLGTIDDRDTTFFNGEIVGAMEVWNQTRVYKIPANLVKAGRAEIAVRVLDTGGGGGFGGGDEMRLEAAADAARKIELSGDWQYQISAALKDLPPLPVADRNNPNQPTVLYNGMIAPLLPFPVRGAIWYQGESNAGNPKQYQTLFPELIRDWRTQWNARQDGSEFGFYFVQLANFMARTDQPVESGWAELREAQTMTLSVPRVGMATILDVGEAADIHPKNKQDVGKRLALAALAKEYGQKLEYSGPMFSKMEMIPDTNRVRISFTHAAGLTVKNAPMRVEYPDVPRDHWAYDALNRLVQAGLVEGYPNGTYRGGRAMIRYEFAVAIARLMDTTKPGSDPTNVPGQPVNTKGIYFDDWTDESKDAFTALKTEFADELRALGVRVDDSVGRLPEPGRIPKDQAPKLTLSPPVKTPQQPKLVDTIKLGAFVKGFAIRGEDGKWFWAEAHLDGETVVLWSDEVLQPVAVRYAWANNPDVNLVNAAGLPAVSFRTDAP